MAIHHEAPLIRNSPSRSGVRPEVIDGIPAEGTSVLVARLEPLVKARPVEEVLAGPAFLVWHLLIRGDDGVTDGTLALTFEGTDHIAAESNESVNDVAVL